MSSTGYPEDKLNERRRSLMSTTSSQRFTLGEIIARMEPTDEQDTPRFGPPLNYGFRDISKIAEVWKVDPREGPHSYVKRPVEFKAQEEVKVKGEKKDQKVEEKQYYKYSSKGLRLSNNSISSFDNFTVGLEAIIEHPLALEWIDLSFNDLTKISDTLLQYKNLKILYLHANYIEDIHSVDKLAAMTNLKTLTLHGNLIEEIKGYRQYVITTLPQLEYLDFSRITKADRDKANVWKDLRLIECGGTKKKRKKPVEQ